jgi:phosphotransacetylase
MFKIGFIRAVLTASTLAVAPIALTGCAHPVQHFTPSGKVETVFLAPTDAVKGRIIGQMTDWQYTVSKDTPYMIAFDRPSQDLMTNVLMGSKYDSTPNFRITYTFIQTQPGSVRVVADCAIITNPGSAYERRASINNSKETMKIQAMLDRLAREFLPKS